MKHVIAFDTLVSGWDCERDEKGNPVIYESRDEAVSELFLDCLDYMLNLSTEEREDLGVYDHIMATMMALDSGGTTEMKESFLMRHPEVNDHELWAEPFETFIENKKTIFK